MRRMLVRATSLLLQAALVLGLVAALPAAPVQAQEQLPDLAALPPDHISMEVTAEGRHLLRFTAKLANVGSGPLHVRGQVKPDGSTLAVQEIRDAQGATLRSETVSAIIFHPHHEHWHAGDVAAYSLRSGSPAGPVVAQNGKISYCFVDDEPLPEYTGPRVPSAYWNCKTHTMGVSPGWVDIYKADLYDQWIDVTGIPDGLYYLVIEADPGNLYIEADDQSRANNTAWARIELSQGGTRVRVVTATQIQVMLDGKPVPDPARLVDGLAFAHVRLSEKLGGRVDWTGRAVGINSAQGRLELIPGSTTAYLNGQPVTLPAAPFMDEDRVFAPVDVLLVNDATAHRDGTRLHISRPKPIYTCPPGLSVRALR